MFKHLLVSLLCAFVDLSIFIYLFEIKDFSLINSYLVGITITTIIGFLGHSFFTFQSHKNYTRNFFSFVIQVIISIILGYSVIFLLIVVIGLNSIFAKIIQMGITFIFNFNFGRLITFK
jgi:putative flippase GtrA